MVILVAGAVAQAGAAMEVYRRPVNLDAGLALGPACQLEGIARGGALWAGEQVVLDGVEAHLTGPVRLVLRPEDMEFLPDPAGPSWVHRCEWHDGAFHIHVQTPLGLAIARGGSAVPPGARGRLLRTPQAD